ncbi:MAG TPA: hypothetical protein VIC62_11780, partial [Nakamurella sp.]
MTATPVTLESRPDRVPDGTAAADLAATDIARLRALTARATPADVQRALTTNHPDLADFAALLSDAAGERL